MAACEIHHLLSRVLAKSDAAAAAAARKEARQAKAAQKAQGQAQQGASQARASPSVVAPATPSVLGASSHNTPPSASSKRLGQQQLLPSLFAKAAAHDLASPQQTAACDPLASPAPLASQRALTFSPKRPRSELAGAEAPATWRSALSGDGTAHAASAWAPPSPPTAWEAAGAVAQAPAGAQGQLSTAAREAQAQLDLLATRRGRTKPRARATLRGSQTAPLGAGPSQGSAAPDVGLSQAAVAPEVGPSQAAAAPGVGALRGGAPSRTGGALPGPVCDLATPSPEKKPRQHRTAPAAGPQARQRAGDLADLGGSSPQLPAGGHALAGAVSPGGHQVQAQASTSAAVAGAGAGTSVKARRRSTEPTEVITLD